MNRIKTYATTGLAFLLVSMMPVASAEPVDDLGEQVDLLFHEVEAILADPAVATKCLPGSSDTFTNKVWTSSWHDEGSAVFTNHLGVGDLLGFSGSGGHTGDVYKCHIKKCTGAYAGHVGDFFFSGSSRLGHGASILIESTERKKANEYARCANGDKGNAILVAKLDSGRIDGNYAASATHPRSIYGASTSEGRSNLQAEGDFVGFTYAYHWDYLGYGSVGGITAKVKCKDLVAECPIGDIEAPGLEIQGFGYDEDWV